MATVNGVISQTILTEKSVADGVHPIVTRAKQFKADNGTLEAGEILALDSNGDVVSYDPDSAGTESTPVGVCAMQTDTSKDTLGVVIVHGTVLRKSLLTLGASASADHISSLESSTQIWAN